MFWRYMNLQRFKIAAGRHVAWSMNQGEIENGTLRSQNDPATPSITCSTCRLRLMFPRCISFSTSNPSENGFKNPAIACYTNEMGYTTKLAIFLICAIVRITVADGVPGAVNYAVLENCKHSSVSSLLFSPQSPWWSTNVLHLFSSFIRTATHGKHALPVPKFRIAVEPRWWDIAPTSTFAGFVAIAIKNCPAHAVKQ